MKLYTSGTGSSTSAEFTVKGKLSSGTGPTVDEPTRNIHDAAQKGYKYDRNGIAQLLSGVIWSKSGDGTVANTTTETTLLDTGVGVKTLPVNFFTIGKTLRIKGFGVISATGTPTMQLRIKLGSTTIVTTGAIAVSGTISNNYFEFEAEITARTIGASGTVIGAGKMFYDNSGNAGKILGMPASTTSTIDTTATQVVDVTAQWGTADAGNTITCTISTIEILN